MTYRTALLALALAGLAFLAACGKREAELTTGNVLQAAQIAAGFKGDTAYAVVRSESIPGLYDNFRSVLSSQGLVKWDSRYDCNHFASLFVALSQTQFAVAAWHSSTKAQTLAMAELWYVPGGVGNKGHAIVQIVTEKGDVYLEPQTGGLLNLTPAELQSVYLRKW